MTAGIFTTTVTTITQWLSQPEFYLEALKRQPFILTLVGHLLRKTSIQKKINRLNNELFVCCLNAGFSHLLVGTPKREP